MKTLNSYNFKNKTVLLRADLNSDFHNKKILMSERIKQSALTINELKKKKAKIVIIAHQSRPGKPDFTSLKQHSKLLNNYTKVSFVEDIIGDKAVKSIQHMRHGEAILLENIRMEADEFKPEKAGKNKLMKLVELADIYVNDAFSVCHRKQASVVLLPKYMKNCAGRLLEREVNALKKLKIKNCLYILGGAKPEENIRLLKGRKVIACGLFGQLCLISRGKNLGEQNKYLKKTIKNYDKIIKELKKKQKNVLVPVDFAVKKDNKRVELGVDEFPSKYEIFDIGKRTQELFVKEIRKAKAVYMKGPAGYCADRKFCKGTITILKAAAKTKFSLIGGGHLSDAIEYSKIKKSKFGHISLSGGALLRVVAGEKLPGLKAMK
jgi:phosphoglycerate kinase